MQINADAGSVWCVPEGVAHLRAHLLAAQLRAARRQAGAARDRRPDGLNMRAQMIDWQLAINFIYFYF